MAFELRRRPVGRPRSGGQARRLTANTRARTGTCTFSPDGSPDRLHRHGRGQLRVYCWRPPGRSQALTYHPGLDRVRGWSPDGRRVDLRVASGPVRLIKRTSTLDHRVWRADSPIRSRCPARSQARTLRTAAGWLTRSSRPPSSRVARDQPVAALQGRPHAPISVIEPGRPAVEKLPWSNSNDTRRCVSDDTIYFLSDRNTR